MALLVFCAALVVLSAARGTELVPERFLRPRDFNHHPFTDVGEAPPVRSSSPLDVHPYAILASKRPREGRQFPEIDNVLYPDPPAEVLPRKPTAHHHVPQYLQIQPQQIHEQPEQHLQQHVLPEYSHQDPYNLIPKNYAFSYSVKDKHSGDDFSHSQAHNGKATKGQYRVKLPDGRVQVVSYTADHKGYVADVQYEGSPHQFQAVTPIYESSPPAPQAYVSSPEHYIQHTTPTPEQYIHASPTPEQYIHASPSPGPYLHASPTPATYLHASPTPQQYIQPSPTPQNDYHQPKHQFVHQLSYYPQQQQQLSYQPQQQQEQVFYTATPSPFRKQPSFSPTPAPYQQFSPTPSSYDYPIEFTGPTAGYRSLPFNAQPGPDPAQSQANRASPSPITFPTSAPDQPPQYATSPGLDAYASPSPNPYDEPTQFIVRSTPAPFARHPNERSILVTPRAQRSSKDKSSPRRNFGERYKSK